MALKRIKCFLIGGHRYSDSNLQVIHDTTGYHFVNHCVKCGKVYAAFMSEGTMQRQIEKDGECVEREKMISLHDYGKEYHRE